MSEVKSYLRYASANPKFDFSFHYPSDWQVREIEQPTYAEIFILGPRNRENTYSLNLTIRVTPSRDRKDKDLNALVADYLAKKRLLSKFKERSRTQGSLSGFDATETEIGYTALLPINNISPRETPILERRIFFQRGPLLYEVIYSAVEEDYLKYLDVFKDAVHTFEFIDNKFRDVHQPLITPVPVHTVKDERENYKSGQ